MDTISLIGPQQPKGALNQEEFDARYNYLRHKKKVKNTQILRTVFLTDNWRNYHSVADFIPLLKWIFRYDVKANGLRDLMGSVFIALLLLPQGLSVGYIVEDVNIGLLSLIVPQIVYCIFGSARHSSLGSLSHAAFLIYSSQTNSSSSLSTLSACVACCQFLLFLFPSDWLFSLFSTQLVTGFSLGIYLRILLRIMPDVLQFTSCSEIYEMGILSCLTSLNYPTFGLFFISLTLSFLFRWKLNNIVAHKVGISVPYEAILVILMSCVSYVLSSTMIKTFPLFPFFPRNTLPLVLPYFPSLSVIVDSMSITLFSMITHYRISRSIAMEKMHKVVRKQELLSFSLISLFSSIFSLLPTSSSSGNSQINIETAKFSLVSNLLSSIWVMLILYLCQDALQIIPICVVCGLIMTSFYGILADIRLIRQLYYSHLVDAIVATTSLLCAIFVPNSCQAFLVSFALSLMTVIFRIQSSHSDVIIKVADNFYAEEARYSETECMDVPVRIIRITAPLIYATSDALKRHIYRQAIIVKGLIGIGIGSRTVSMRSTGAVGPKESIDAKSSLNLTNIVITHEDDGPQGGRSGSEIAIVTRFIILDCTGMKIIDYDAVQMLSQVFFDLSNDHIRLMFAGVNATVRDSLETSGFYSSVPQSSFFPTVGQALRAARNIVLPFHMSVSMNGCRDVITLSTAGSHQDVSRHSPEAV